MEGCQQYLLCSLFQASSQFLLFCGVKQPSYHRRDQNQIAGLAREYDYMGRSLMFFWSHVDVMENSKMLPSNRITHFSGWWSRPPLPPGYGSTLLLLHMRQWSNAWLLEWSIKMKKIGRIRSFHRDLCKKNLTGPKIGGLWQYSYSSSYAPMV